MIEINEESANESKTKWIPNHIEENYYKKLFKIVKDKDEIRIIVATSSLLNTHYAHRQV